MPRPALLLALAVVLAALFAAAVAPPLPSARAGDDVVQTYRKRFAKEGYRSDREDVLSQLAAAGSPEAREGIVWCIAKCEEFLAAAEKDSDRLAKQIQPLEGEFDEQLRRYLEQETKKGNPNPKTRPIFPVEAKLTQIRADLTDAERRMLQERELRAEAYECHGKCVDAMPDAKQSAYQDAVRKGPIASKDWAVRGELWRLLGGAKAAWVTALLLDAAQNEPDARALVPALDGLGGRDAKIVTAALAARLGDARWLVRAAALGALERTPSREGIDAIVAAFAREDGRLRDDCLRILEALTGADLPHTPEAWARWWAENRAKWEGPPPAAKGPGVTEEKLAAEAKKREGKTGFFGVETNSRRLCFVIDLSGSMREKAAEKGDESRADRAKVELVRAIRALEDGSTFALVMFASDVRVWRPDMTEAGDETRKAAVQWVESAPVDGATNTYGALEAAFQLGEPSKPKASDPYSDPKLDTIILLSDGKPTRGRTVVPAEIRAAVRDWNSRRRVTVHTIAFGKDADFDFLKGIATDTGGSFTAQ